MGIYRLLLHLYPTSFRNEYGEQMCLVFEQRRRDASGLFASIVLWIESVLGTLSDALLVHWDLLAQDVRYTVRMLRRAPGFALTTVLIVALGIGATTAAFSVTDYVLLRPLPFFNPGRLVTLWERTPGYSHMELSPINYREWKGASKSFERIGAYVNLPVNMVGKDEPLRLDRAAVDSDLLPTLGVQPVLGRTFTAADDRTGAPGTVILSYRLWQSQFGAAQAVVGQSITLDNEPYTIIGVMPRQFRFPDSDTSLWTTMRFPEEVYKDRNDNWLYAVGRLRAGTMLEQARAEWHLLAAQTERQYPKEMEHTGAALFLLSDDFSKRSRLLLEALCGAAACVLLIACANLANLLLARALGRRREIAVRAALGAGRERLVRQLITESLLLAFVGGAIGVGIATSAVPLLARLVPESLPIAAAPSVDLRVLLFAAILTVITGVAFGLAPVMRLGRDDSAALHEGPRAGGGRKERLRSGLVVAEIVASIVLLVSAGLLLRALWNIQSRDPGFKAEGVLTLRTPLPMPQYANVAPREAFYNRVLSEVRALPGVTSAAYVTAAPMVWGGGIWPIEIAGHPATRAENQVASLRYLTPGFFATLGIPLKRGRDVSDADTRARPFVAVVSESFVRRYWPNEDPLGRHFKFALSDRTVAGVVGDIRMRGLEQASEPQVYLPYRQVEDQFIIGYIPKDLVVRASAAPAALLPSIRAIVRRADPKLPVSNVRTMTDIVTQETASRSVQLRVIGAFAVMAFLLAAIGIHGVLAFSVAQRTQEFGIRMALGAQPGNILNMVVRQGLLLATAGVIPGIALAYAAGRAMQALLVGVTPGDVRTFVAVAGLAIVMTAAGTLVPTLRALKVDPMMTIRSE